ncbi:hypothetical protein AMS59_23745 [Lysinibacillus sp. FJAT-14745]|nr:hypothetical protein AMS59_23745 [Lysinibacillus sp. FJAT-14745]
MEFLENLHYSIFTSNYWRTCKILKKIKDFYKTALSLSHADVIDLIDELKYVQHFFKGIDKNEIDHLISKLSKDDIYTVKFLGD